MSKPIEKGCRAVIVNSLAGNDGIIVTVGEFIGEIAKTRSKRHWEIDVSLRRVGIVTGEFKKCAKYCSEERLQRIDDGEKLTTWQSIEQLTNWNPEKVAAENEK